jgi:hypothetical protein
VIDPFSYNGSTTSGLDVVQESNGGRVEDVESCSATTKAEIIMKAKNTRTNAFFIELLKSKTLKIFRYRGFA